MTELLYLRDCYLRTFDARVLQSGKGWAILDRTALYAEGGGQETDYGTLEWDGGSVRVNEVRKQKGFDGVIHYFDEDVIIPEGTGVRGSVDWDRRYKEMRMHTAQHLFSALVLDAYGAETVGNQIHPEISHVDFGPIKITQEAYERIADKFNSTVDKKAPVRISFMSRARVLAEIDEKRRNLFSRVPETVEEVRVIEIEGFDRAPCGGTHVANTGELGHMVVLNVENKGKDKQRVEFKLSPSAS
ncbi:MAG: alanyl-tRNA editing protein [Candidatus Aenigmarchaeota archaeon]|nr:alanyl-tRNA editing protein [Candidatus Aenigmarchaeota archaeon]